ncbi:MAG TPA: hypothetical protein VIV06_00100 [Candidatus Limnocylindrales bacterium]
MIAKHLTLALVALALAPAAPPAFAVNCRLKSALDITARGATIGSKGTAELRAEGERQRLRISMDARVPDGTVFGVFVNGSLAGTLAIELGAGEVDLGHGDGTCLRSGVNALRGSQRIEVMDRAGNQVLRGTFRTPTSCSDPEVRD